MTVMNAAHRIRPGMRCSLTRWGTSDSERRAAISPVISVGLDPDREPGKLVKSDAFREAPVPGIFHTTGRNRLTERLSPTARPRLTPTLSVAGGFNTTSHNHLQPGRIASGFGRNRRLEFNWQTDCQNPGHQTSFAEGKWHRVCSLGETCDGDGKSPRKSATTVQTRAVVSNSPLTLSSVSDNSSQRQWSDVFGVRPVETRLPCEVHL